MIGVKTLEVRKTHRNRREHSGAEIWRKGQGFNREKETSLGVFNARREHTIKPRVLRKF